MRKIQYKTCCACKIKKPLGQFHKHKGRKDGRQTACKECSSKSGKFWYESRGRNNQQDPAVKAGNAKRDRKRWHETGTKRNYYYLRKYGITLDEYNYILERQGGGCALCGFIPTGKQFNLPVDHDHETGEVRGILCRRCNVVLGIWGDRFDLIVEKLKSYFGEK